jgi:hypothetical protein
MATSVGLHALRITTSLLPREAALLPLLADVRSPVLSLSVCYLQNSFLLRHFSRLCPPLRSALLPRTLIRCSGSCPKDSGNAEDSLAGSRQSDPLESLDLAVPPRLLPVIVMASVLPSLRPGCRLASGLTLQPVLQLDNLVFWRGGPAALFSS